MVKSHIVIHNGRTLQPQAVQPTATSPAFFQMPIVQQNPIQSLIEAGYITTAQVAALTFQQQLNIESSAVRELITSGQITLDTALAFSANQRNTINGQQFPLKVIGVNLSGHIIISGYFFGDPGQTHLML